MMPICTLGIQRYGKDATLLTNDIPLLQKLLPNQDSVAKLKAPGRLEMSRKEAQELLRALEEIDDASLSEKEYLCSVLHQEFRCTERQLVAFVKKFLREALPIPSH